MSFGVAKALLGDYIFVSLGVVRHPKMDETKDPSDGLMDLLKNMYEDGDDDMKKTISKAWTESQNKAPADIQ